MIGISNVWISLRYNQILIQLELYENIVTNCSKFLFFAKKIMKIFPSTLVYFPKPEVVTRQAINTQLYILPQKLLIKLRQLVRNSNCAKNLAYIYHYFQSIYGRSATIRHDWKNLNNYNLSRRNSNTLDGPPILPLTCDYRIKFMI